MRRLTKPPFTVSEVLEECASTVQDNALVAKIISSADDIVAAEARYDQHGNQAELFLLPESDCIGLLENEAMEWIYTEKLAGKGTARSLYDRIRNAPKNGICPLCAQRTVFTLDHYLAQGRHAAYTVTPYNLIPACRDCNTVKLFRQPAYAGDQTLHPYYDNVDDGVWLKARIEPTRPPTVEFFVDCPADWAAIKSERTNTHFRIFGLAELYAANSAQELAGIALVLNDLAVNTGAIGVRQHLETQAASRRAAAVNSWQAALYLGLATDDWFWNGGHRDIVN